MRILITGAKGQLGTDICNSLEKSELLKLDLDNCDICNFEQLNPLVRSFRPECIIHSAAWGDVESSEKDLFKSFSVNAFGTKNVAAVAKQVNAYTVYISTDYVFSGSKGSFYTEEDEPGPVNVYGLSKLTGEYFIKEIVPGYCIVRTSGLYGRSKCLSKGTNFVDRILEKAEKVKQLTVVSDQRLSPTSTADLARQLKLIVEHRIEGIVHAVNAGAVSWFEFASEIIKIKKIPVEVVPVSSDMYPSAVKRPGNSSLSCGKLKDKGIYIMKDIETALKEYLVNSDCQRKGKGVCL